jgi:uncharacterized SAM-binding protein YcdF (DUF218 family)
VGVTFTQVWWASRQSDEVPADAIVVLGAAQWNGRPSPVLAARLDHAVELWEEDLAGVIVVAGGKQDGDTVTQGIAGYRYLVEAGVPEAALRVEVEGTDTFTELSATAVILETEGLGDEVLLVSDPYHSFRAAAIAREVGLRPHVAPTDSTPRPAYLARETVAVGVGRLIGYRRLSNWT